MIARKGLDAALREGDYVLLGYLEEPEQGFTHPLTAPDLPFIKSAKLTRFELYNVEEDLEQRHDLAEEEPGRLDAMKNRIRELHRELVAEGPAWELESWR